ncbi:hypothetical protein NPIL_259771, partial [Nephila pilipes]
SKAKQTSHISLLLIILRFRCTAVDVFETDYFLIFWEISALQVEDVQVL